MKTFKTKSGTELPLLSLKGKDYLQVQYRVLWFREEHPDWSIQTSFLKLEQDYAIAKAVISAPSGQIIAEATKSETKQGFDDFIEKAESGAVGRALAFIGYGTQFAQELEEGERIVDSPREPKSPSSDDPGAYVIKMGNKLKGKRLMNCDVYELDNYSKWLSQQPDLKGIGLETRDAIDAFLATREVKAK